MKNDNLTLGSLFDGSGGFPMGGLLAGITPVWASEIEPFAVRVTSKRLPWMRHYGDISTISGAELEPVDIITFGSPCQDMSIAGKRSGLDGSRSSLFYEAIRIIKEMRCATNGKYPRYCVWENVPGAFSSNGGRDFQSVLETVIGVKEADAQVPPPGKDGWPYADLYMGDGWSLAYRVFDAQYWGVPQRRRRIYLVADFRGQRAGEILLKPEGLRRISAQSGTQGQETARCAKNSVGTAIGGVDRYNQSFLPGLAQTLRAPGGGDCTPTVLAPVGKEKTVAVPVHYIVRRLTPTECARLQGFPDLWGYLDKKESFTDEEYKFWLEVRNTYARINNKAVKDYTKAQMLSWYNKLHSDSAEYKMWGNGIALPNALYVMQGIAAEAEIPINLF